MMALLMPAGYPSGRQSGFGPAAGIIKKKPRDHLSPLRTLGKRACGQKYCRGFSLSLVLGSLLRLRAGSLLQLC
jgi:hypothetical protein